jgi:predicted amidohydrolase
MNYQVGVAQFEPIFLDIETNLQIMENLLKGCQADLVVFPELSTSGYVFKSIEEVKSVSESAFTGRTATLFKKLAKQYDCSLVVGFPEKYRDQYFNSSILVNPDGKIYVYRKIHLFYEEKLFFAPGNIGFQVFPAKKDVQVGLMICFDWIFPEATRTLSLKGAEIIAHSANLVLPWCQQAMITRSLENRVFSITSNRIGTEINGESKQTFTGMSQILGTRGEILKRMQSAETGIEYFTIDPSLAKNKTITEFNDAFSDRRNEFYSC